MCCPGILVWAALALHPRRTCSRPWLVLLLVLSQGVSAGNAHADADFTNYSSSTEAFAAASRFKDQVPGFVRCMSEAVEEDNRNTEEATEAAALVHRLIAEKRESLKELRGGFYCDQCWRTATQIRVELKEEFQTHLKRVNGHPKPAPASKIREKTIEYDNKIDSALSEVTRHEKRHQQLNQRWGRCNQDYHQSYANSERARQLGNYLKFIEQEREEELARQRKREEENQRRLQGLREQSELLAGLLKTLDRFSLFEQARAADRDPVFEEQADQQASQRLPSALRALSERLVSAASNNLRERPFARVIGDLIEKAPEMAARTYRTINCHESVFPDSADRTQCQILLRVVPKFVGGLVLGGGAALLARYVVSGGAGFFAANVLQGTDFLAGVAGGAVWAGSELYKGANGHVEDLGKRWNRVVDKDPPDDP